MGDGTSKQFDGAGVLDGIYFGPSSIVQSSTPIIHVHK